jgi:hypothetical protein
MVLELWRSSSPEGYFHEVKFKYAPAGFGVRRGQLRWSTLTKHWSNLLHGNPVFRHVVSCDEIALRKILLLG